ACDLWPESSRSPSRSPLRKRVALGFACESPRITNSLAPPQLPAATAVIPGAMLRGRGSNPCTGAARRRWITAAAALTFALGLPAAASAKVWIVNGAGFGNGVGLGQ